MNEARASARGQGGQNRKKPSRKGKYHGGTAMNKKISVQGKWKRVFDFDFRTRAFFTIVTDRYKIVLSGGSVKVSDIETGKALFAGSGFRYLYTGDVSPDEKVLAALENGKHFYIFSLETFEPCGRVTLPRGYESIDGYPSFSPCGKELLVPVSRYSGERAGYLYYICRYDARTYQFVAMEETGRDDFPAWPVPL